MKKSLRFSALALAMTLSVGASFPVSAATTVAQEGQPASINNASYASSSHISNFQTCRAACPPYVVPAFRHKQCMNPASLQFRLSLSRAILSMRISVHYRARRGEWRKTILSRKLICAVILFKHKQLRPRVRTLII